MNASLPVIRSFEDVEMLFGYIRVNEDALLETFPPPRHDKCHTSFVVYLQNTTALVSMKGSNTLYLISAGSHGILRGVKFWKNMP